MDLTVSIKNVQHISFLKFSLNALNNNLICIAGKNGSGKTTLIRALQNIKYANTFRKTASPYIFKSDSEIIYTINGHTYTYRYEDKIDHIDSKTVIDNTVKESIFVELPIPYGVRFNHNQKLTGIDEELRQKITLKDYTSPLELILFLKSIYPDNRFDELKQAIIKGEKYYFIIKDGNYYIREDYFSSGEYFIIHLYKLLQKKCQLIVIDEIDISLDASAQAKLVHELRKQCVRNNISMVFTTHSLALIKTLNDREIYYMENNNGSIDIRNISYNHIKSLLFGFLGWDKYILVEDDMLESYISFLLKETKNYYKYKIIYIGGSDNVADLLKRNEKEEIFSQSENVIAILDGDVKDTKSLFNHDNIFFIPIPSVEKELAKHYLNGEFNFSVDVFGKEKNYAKNLYTQIVKKHMSQIEIFEFINNKNKDSIDDFKAKISSFLQSDT